MTGAAGRSKHGKTIRQELDKELRSYGVDPLKTHMSDAEFASVMEELDRRRQNADAACAAADPELKDHMEFMRATIRHHLQAEAEAYRRSGIAKEEADPPPNLERRDTEDLALAEDIPTPRVSNIPMDEDDEDAATLGRFKPSSDKRGPATARRDDGGDGNFGSDYSASNYSASPTGSQREALLRDEEDNFGSPPQASRAPKSAKSAGPAASSKGEGAGSDIEMLSSFDASSEEDAPGAGVPVLTKSGPVWSQAHDDPFDTSADSAGGGLWGASPSGPRPFTKTSSMASHVPDAYSDDDFDGSVEELLA
eukprot:jgi/Tetstr1/426980/TSEL_017193.t1